jgi:hypothetical protein
MISCSKGVQPDRVLLLGLVILLQAGCASSAGDKIMRPPCDIPPGQNVMQAQQDAMRKSHMIFGEVLRVDGTTYVLKDDDGKEVSVKIDESTEKPPINKGDRIAANVDNQNSPCGFAQTEGRIVALSMPRLTAIRINLP